MKIKIQAQARFRLQSELLSSSTHCQIIDVTEIGTGKDRNGTGEGKAKRKKSTSKPFPIIQPGSFLLSYQPLMTR